MDGGFCLVRAAKAISPVQVRPAFAEDEFAARKRRLLGT
jgi:hypothetical protein